MKGGDQLVFREELGDLAQEDAPASHGGTKMLSRGRERREERGVFGEVLGDLAPYLEQPSLPLLPSLLLSPLRPCQSNAARWRDGRVVGGGRRRRKGQVEEEEVSY
jgi:hypothetical protein